MTFTRTAKELASKMMWSANVCMNHVAVVTNPELGPLFLVPGPLDPACVHVYCLGQTPRTFQSLSGTLGQPTFPCT